MIIIIIIIIIKWIIIIIIISCKDPFSCMDCETVSYST